MYIAPASRSVAHQWALPALPVAELPVPPAVEVPVVEAPLWPRVGRLRDPRINELSGIAPSHAQPGIHWVHNDSGDVARIFAISTSGETRATITVEGAAAFDWEDITLAAGPDGRDWVWVADTGDNRRVRSTVQLYGFPEPDARAGDVTVRARRIDVTYPRAGRHDVEAFFVDPLSGDGYLITKERIAPGLVLRLPAAQLARGMVQAEQVGQLPPRMRITGGDIRRDGGAIVLRDYEHAYAWPRRAGERVEDALQRLPVRIPAPDGSEAIAFLPGGRDWISVPEGVSAPISTWPVPIDA